MRVMTLATAALLAFTVGAFAENDKRSFDHLIAHHAETNDVPVELVNAVIKRESGFNPRLTHAGNWGLMQIKPATARGMGYKGSPQGLLDPNTNLTYAVAYLGNAYRVAGRDMKRAIGLYARGFYYEAKRKGMLKTMRVAATQMEATASSKIEESPSKVRIATADTRLPQPVSAEASAVEAAAEPLF